MKKLLLLVTLFLVIPCLIMARIVPVALNDDVHFDYMGLQANDFHIEGTVHSAGGIPPMVANIIVFGDPGTGNWRVQGYSLQRIGASDDWIFKLDFVTDGFITFCQWIHFGIMFNVENSNIIFNLVGWWTLNGNPLSTSPTIPLGVGETQGDPNEFFQTAVTGFNVSNGMLTIQNATNMPVEIKQYELAVTWEFIPLENMFITGLGRPGEPSPMYPQLSWIDAIIEPIILSPGEQHHISLASLGINLQPNQKLLMRGEQIMVGSKIVPLVLQEIKKAQNLNDWGWFWEQHGQ
jgi:hypothetical protein